MHNYQEDQGNTGELRDSGAVVQVHWDLGLLRTINIPAGEEGAYWEVGAIDGATGKLTVVNALRARKPTSVEGGAIDAPGIKAMSDGETRGRAVSLGVWRSDVQREQERDLWRRGR